METTKNKLPEVMQDFFRRLSDYLNTKLYFYGSVQRSDYFPGSSDIDVDIFTDNADSTIAKLQHFLTVQRKSFKKIIYNIDNKVVHGYKIMYKQLPTPVEFSIYNEKNKSSVLHEHRKKMQVPFYISFGLFIIKKLYYNIHIISLDTYSQWKLALLTRGLGFPIPQFVTIDENH